MDLKQVSNWKSDTTYSLTIEGRNATEVKKAKEMGYKELSRFKISNKIRTDAYMCGACKAFNNKPFTMPVGGSDHDGFCGRYKIRVKDYATCNGFQAKMGLFSHNPA